MQLWVTAASQVQFLDQPDPSGILIPPHCKTLWGDGLYPGCYRVKGDQKDLCLGDPRRYLAWRDGLLGQVYLYEQDWKTLRWRRPFAELADSLFPVLYGPRTCKRLAEDFRNYAGRWNLTASGLEIYQGLVSAYTIGSEQGLVLLHLVQ